VMASVAGTVAIRLAARVKIWTHRSVFWGRESPTYQLRAKSIPRAENRP
jgi:hypothetical protein